ncbi:ImmA/IrrE family metallo-endopeptidase [Agrobacterium vitis]|uniref:ImmA/IrrE family metallo-endopeptidase n=1 Tax=Agrobacterium vitis TaxID=373 RepID=A0A368NJA1_AGRVI|nr:ImmA/IrrE family metallo-endopeptidase [Agrobacterium vitis]KAA3506218.1 ImmA/IrrE family metallo-endopeptidase [Agrobacterium vitis]KAA3520647.1 ImmA/IrrE family metallo-endopeptidase [Agrobacterium vitis]MBF2712978.1 ImmA/IrrE family metallo-endopeptidase [Agrobacterium vitis]MCF1480169.1 ImmA/IrrE family metallo-endopeptidase [Agrobacterium vitis]MUP07842.1 ImmA/IrrE family metallo-endopeptidase [Agrobacterium vitis]
MNDELMMDLADCAAPESIIACILRHHPDWAAPVPIEDLASSINIIDILEMETEEFEGGLTTDPDKRKGVILYKAGTKGGRRRFTIAHEIGHFLIPWHKGDQRCTKKDMIERRIETLVQKQETEANRFAAGILMPRPWFVSDMRKLGDADVEHVKTLARQYGTSVEATVARYVELTDDCCAFVFSKDGIIRYTRATKDFPPLSVRSKHHLPERSLSGRSSNRTQSRPSEWAEIQGSVWLNGEGRSHCPKVLEQTLLQREGYQLTLLFIAPDEIEDAEEIEALEESWTPRFRR